MEIRKVTFLLTVLLLIMPFWIMAVEASEKIIFEKNSVYQYIQVVEDPAKKERYVRNQRRDVSQGAISLNEPGKLIFEYARMGFISMAFLDREPNDALFVGLGAGSMPKYFSRHYPDANIDVAEIDPDMVSVAQKYFYFTEHAKMKVHVEDGRIFIKKSKKKYDVIVLDAYQNDYIPFHLTTVEFLKEVRKRLKDGGVVVANIMSPFGNKFFDSMIMTYKEVFPHLYIFKGKSSANYIFVAGAGNIKRDKESIVAKAGQIEKARHFDFNLADMAARYEYSSAYEWKGAKILTDDFAPVNLYRYQASEKR